VQRASHVDTGVLVRYWRWWTLGVSCIYVELVIPHHDPGGASVCHATNERDSCDGVASTNEIVDGRSCAIKSAAIVLRLDRTHRVV